MYEVILQSLSDEVFEKIWSEVYDENKRRSLLKVKDYKLNFVEIQQISIGNFIEAIKMAKHRLNCSLLTAKELCEYYREMMRVGDNLTRLKNE